MTVICLSFNHEEFVEEALYAVINQTYSPIELIIVDDASEDGSVALINEFVKKYPTSKFIRHERNMGNCISFNQGFKLSDGKYIIDLAADDVLMPDRIEAGVKALEEAGNDFGVQFSDAELIDDAGAPGGLHSDKYPHDSIPQGDIYLDVINRYFICSPTMLIKREVLEHLQGYDETLAYEDFDFWVRSSRQYKYLYLPSALVKRRILHNSMKQDQFRRGSAQLKSTLEICKKIKVLNKNEVEKAALKKRLLYEIKVSLRLFDMGLVLNYLKLMIRGK